MSQGEHPDHPPIEGGYTGITPEILPIVKAILKEYYKCWVFSGKLPNSSTHSICISSDLLYDLYEAIYGTVPSK